MIMGLAPGEVFTQRNVGNQATHSDMNAMSCLEYAVTELKVREGGMRRWTSRGARRRS